MYNCDSVKLTKQEIQTSVDFVTSLVKLEFTNEIQTYSAFFWVWLMDWKEVRRKFRAGFSKIVNKSYRNTYQKTNSQTHQKSNH